jgi:hypothetical protein
MRKEHLLLSTAAGLAVALLTAGPGAVRAQAEGLSGQVTSPQGPLEGVLVTAKKAGSTIAYTVATDDKGHYSFPSAKIESGEYTLSIRATGYDLDGAGTATVAAQKGATADLKLKQTRNLPAQLTNAEWIQHARPTSRSVLSAVKPRPRGGSCVPARRQRVDANPQPTCVNYA